MHVTRTRLPAAPPIRKATATMRYDCHLLSTAVQCNLFFCKCTKNNRPTKLSNLSDRGSSLTYFPRAVLSMSLSLLLLLFVVFFANLVRCRPLPPISVDPSLGPKQPPQLIQLQPPNGWSKEAVIGLCSIFVALFCCCVNLIWPSAWLWLRSRLRNKIPRTCKYNASSDVKIGLIHGAHADIMLSTRTSTSCPSFPPSPAPSIEMETLNAVEAG
jgi:hypothetical protein